MSIFSISSKIVKYSGDIVNKIDLEKYLQIDPEKYSIIIQSFIKKKILDLNRNGIVIPISGGLDSSVVATLCVKAIGKEKVTGLLLPEKQGNPEAEKYAYHLATFLGIKTKKIDISQTLKKIGTFNFILSLIPGYNLKKEIVKTFLSSSKENLFIKAIRGEADSLMRKGVASFYTKQRIRLVVTYKYAEENNLLVAGSAHKTEDYIGLYVKFGVDDMADIMPLRRLFRTQILQIADFLNIPKIITDRKPNPDLIPGISDKYYDVLGIKYDQIDMILVCIEQSLPAEQIVENTDIPLNEVEKIIELYRLTDHMRNPSMTPQFD